MSNKTNTTLDDLIEHERRRASERIAKLKRAAAAEQRRVNARVIELLREQEPDLYDQLSIEAREALVEEKSKRSSRAKKATKPSSVLHQEDAPWNG